MRGEKADKCIHVTICTIMNCENIREGCIKSTAREWSKLVFSLFQQRLFNNSLSVYTHLQHVLKHEQHVQHNGMIKKRNFTPTTTKNLMCVVCSCQCSLRFEYCMPLVQSCLKFRYISLLVAHFV